MIRRILAAIALALVPLGVGGGTAWWGWQVVHQPFQGFEGEETAFELPSGWDAGRVLTELADEGIIAQAGAARLYLLYVLDDPALHAGEYLFQGASTIPEVLAALIEGRVATYPVTVIEGLTLVETAEALSTAGFGDRDRLIEIMSEPRLVADLDAEASDLEGYLFPDTYRFSNTANERDIVAAMVANFRRKLENALQAAEPRPLLGVRELVTLASIVEKEALLDAERPLIAGVYSHRLRRRIPLAADPTVIFALKKAGTWDGNLRRPDLQLDDPYNTYRYGGLPPGPICSPGASSLAAAAAPTDTTHLYFVSRNDGTHVFADTLSEHNRNVDKWQRQYWRERWRRERAAAEAK